MLLFDVIDGFRIYLELFFFSGVGFYFGFEVFYVIKIYLVVILDSVGYFLVFDFVFSGFFLGVDLQGQGIQLGRRWEVLQVFVFFFKGRLQIRKFFFEEVWSIYGVLDCVIQNFGFSEVVGFKDKLKVIGVGWNLFGQSLLCLVFLFRCCGRSSFCFLRYLGWIWVFLFYSKCQLYV